MTGISRRELGRLVGGAGAASLTLGASSTFAIAQSAPRVVIVGGGAGGATVAHYLIKDRKPTDPQIDITLIEANPIYSSSFFSNLFLGGFRTLESLSHDYKGLSHLGIKVVHDYVTAVDTAKRTVATRGGATVSYDRLVLSPGMQIKYDAIAGYTAEAAKEFPHAYDTDANGKRMLHAAMEKMPDGGTFLMVMPANPFRCPPGPYERACMIAHYLKTRKPKSKLVILDPKKAFSKQPVFAEGFAKYYKGIIELNLSTDFDDFAVTELDGKARQVKTKSGQAFKFDAANIIPNQKAGQIAIAAGLTKGDWVPINPENFTAQAAKNVYVVGDSTIASQMPKSAFSANSQGKVVAADILADLSKQEKFPPRFRNTCWSLIAPDDCVKVGANYTPKDGKLASVGGFVSQPGEPEGQRRQNYAEAVGWYAGITEDMFAKTAVSKGSGAGSSKG